MSVYIPGMAMPKGCASCKISRRNSKKMICPFIWKCEWDIHDPMSADHRLDGCPLVPVPKHGRLIDADALLESELGYTIPNYNSDGYVADLEGAYTEVQIENAPTIIPASEEGE